MTEKRFQYIRNKYRHYIHDVEKDGEYQKGYRGTYDEFDLNEITNLLNFFNDENEQLKQDNTGLMWLLENQSIIIQELHSKLLEYQLKEPITLTKEDLEIMGKAISYYTHGRI